MELSISDEKTKEIFTEILIDLLKTRKDLFAEIIQEAMEEVGLANAIMEGRKNDFVSEAEVFSILNSYL
jgi:hypothetical protein